MLTKAKKKLLTEALRPLVKSVLVEMVEAEKKPKRRVKAKVEEEEDDDIEEDEDDIEEDEDVEEDEEEVEEEDEEDEDMDDEDDEDTEEDDEEECDMPKKKKMKESVDEVSNLRAELRGMKRGQAIQGMATKLGVKLKRSVLEGLIEMPAEQAKLFLTEMAGGGKGAKSGRMMESDSGSDDWVDALLEGSGEAGANAGRSELVGLLTN